MNPAHSTAQHLVQLFFFSSVLRSVLGVVQHRFHCQSVCVEAKPTALLCDEILITRMSKSFLREAI